MRRALWILSVAVIASGSCTRTSPERQAIEDAASALGGRDRVLAVKTLIVEGAGTNGNLGQDMTPEAMSQTFRVTEYRRSIDRTGRRVRIEQTRTPDFLFFQGQAPQKQVLGLDGAVAYNIGGNGAATRAGNDVARDRRLEFYHHPLTIVRAALDSSAMLGQPRAVAG